MDTLKYSAFYNRLDQILSTTLNRNIVIYGCNRGGNFIKWFYSKYYGKRIKAMVDYNVNSVTDSVLHLYSFYYLYDSNDVIINTTPNTMGDEYRKVGDDWIRSKYSKVQEIHLWAILYDDKTRSCFEKVSFQDGFPQVTYFDWIEYNCAGGGRHSRADKRKLYHWKKWCCSWPLSF